LVSNWFKGKPNIQLIKWPGNSLDLNPIENVWSLMKMQLQEDTHPTNLQALKEEITRLWVLKMADSQVLRNMVESMPDRLQEVIQWGGNTTKY
jgi:hypothetical protein